MASQGLGDVPSRPEEVPATDCAGVRAPLDEHERQELGDLRVVALRAWDVMDLIYPPDVWPPDWHPSADLGPGERAVKRLNAALGAAAGTFPRRTSRSHTVQPEATPPDAPAPTDPRQRKPEASSVTPPAPGDAPDPQQMPTSEASAPSVTGRSEVAAAGWAVNRARNGYEVSPGVMLEAACHHRRRGQMGACGACYARVVETLKEIAKRPPDCLPGCDCNATRARNCLDAMKAEGCR